MDKADRSPAIPRINHGDSLVHACCKRICSRLFRSGSTAGFTLVEMLVTIMVLSVVVIGVCDVVVANQKAWDRQSGVSEALIATDQAMTDLHTYISNAMDARIYTRTTTADVLVVCMPADLAHGVYVPSHEGVFGHTDTLEYQPGQSIVFYLSDSTGSFNSTGNILWAGTVPGWETPTGSNVTPDVSWSLHPGTLQGRCSPIVALRFVSPNGQQYASIEATVTSSYKIAGNTVNLTRTRRICLRSQPY